VVLRHVVWLAHKAFGISKAQFYLFVETIFVRIASRTLLVLSTCPFSCGWYGEVILCLI
jgi:hypothetical protein